MNEMIGNTEILSSVIAFLLAFILFLVRYLSGKEPSSKSAVAAAEKMGRVAARELKNTIRRNVQSRIRKAVEESNVETKAIIDGMQTANEPRVIDATRTKE